MVGNFLGKGLRFPLGPDRQAGGLAEECHEAKIRQSIWIILTTAPGERVMRGDFGCGIHDLLFETQSDTLIGKVADEVRLALARWEPRIDVNSVSVRRHDSERNVLLITVNYLVRATNSRQNLVYPFYVS